jgi:hypothetical protein
MRGHYETDPEASFADWSAKLVLIETVLRSGWVRPDETWKLQSLGVAFGDALAQYKTLDWVVVDDEYGRDPALRDGETSLKLFPLTMISKRVQEGETVDPIALFKELCAKVDDVRAKLRN